MNKRLHLEKEGMKVYSKYREKQLFKMMSCHFYVQDKVWLSWDLDNICMAKLI